MPRILHVSDVHAHPGRGLPDLAVEIANAAKSMEPDCLVCAGDIAHQGENHLVGAAFIMTIASELSIAAERVIFCPGNHDLVGTSLAEYKAAVVRSLNRDDLSSRPASIYVLDDVAFVIVNSVYHRDRTFGQVDSAAVNAAVREAPSDRSLVVVLHHHCFGAGDVSNVRNAHDFLGAIASEEVDLVLHGHRHISLTLKLSGARLVGVGTVAAPPATNINNQFNFLVPGERIVRFRRIDDRTAHGSRWMPEEERW